MTASGCVECGAPEVDGFDCWWLMGAVCAWEYDDPELAALHFHTIASYNLQHPSLFTDEALVGLKELFRQGVDEKLPSPEIRRRAGKASDGAKRVLRRDEAVSVPYAWSMTIADVYNVDEPIGAADRVRAWAAVVRASL